MRFQLSSIAVVAVALAGVVYNVAGAQTSAPALNAPHGGSQRVGGSPVEVEDCKLQENGGLLVGHTGKLTIEFTNESSVKADLVRFRIEWGKDNVDFIRDQGSFAPGVTAKDEFGQSEGVLISPLFSHPDFHCSVESVHFVNGTTWARPEAPATTTSGTLIYPTSQPLQLIGTGFIGVELQPMLTAVRVRLVLPGSPANKGGLKQGDIIETINGEQLTGLQDAVDLISSAKPHSVLKLGIYRNGKILKVRVVAGKRSGSFSGYGPV